MPSKPKLKNGRKAIQNLYSYFLLSHMWLFVNGLPEARMLHYILERTLRFGKYQEDLSPYDFGGIYTKVFIMGMCGWDKRWIQKVKRRLRDKHKLIFYEYSPAKSTSRVTYTVNLPGMARVLLRLYKKQDEFIEEYGAEEYREDFNRFWIDYKKTLENSFHDFEALGLDFKAKVFLNPRGIDPQNYQCLNNVLAK
jgi:hypothetical protein